MKKRLLVLMLFALLSARTVLADDSDSAATLELLKTLLRMDTSNPPGDTNAVASHLKQLFDRHRIANEIIVSPNGKAAHFIARLHGDGSKRPVLLAAHTDVVPVQRERWSVDPFGGIEQNQYVYGRGALDNKSAVAAFATAVLKLEQQGIALNRDIIFLAEADEEQGEFNTGWLAQHHWSKIDAEFALNEGGSSMLDANGRVKLVAVSTADKVTLNLKLVTSGKSGHSSRPLPVNETANGQLIAALARLSTYETAIQLSATSRSYLQTLAELNPGPFADAVRQLLAAKDPQQLQRHARTVIATENTGGWGVEGLLRNTLVITMLDSGVKPNVIPGSAEAVMNARLLPGTSVQDFIAELARVIDNPAVRIEIIHRLPPAQVAEFFRARSNIPPSPDATALFDAIRKAAGETWPGAKVAPTLLVASTDAAAWRERGVPVYGLGPFPVDRDGASRIHGDDERIALKSLREGSDFVYRILRLVAAPQGL